MFQNIEGLYNSLGGFDIKGIKKYDELPKDAKDYVQAVEDITKTPVSFIGTGPDREDIIVRDKKVLTLKQ